MFTSPRKDAGLVAVWNRRIGQSLEAINDMDARRFHIKKTGTISQFNRQHTMCPQIHTRIMTELSDDHEETPAQARNRALLASLDAVLNEVNKDSIPTSMPIADGETKTDVVTAQSYQHFKVVMPPAQRHRAVKISLDAIVGDPDLVRPESEFTTLHLIRSSDCWNFHSTQRAVCRYGGVSDARAQHVEVGRRR